MTQLPSLLPQARNNYWQLLQKTVFEKLLAEGTHHFLYSLVTSSQVL